MINSVSTKETCRLLKDAGMPQEGGGLYWVNTPIGVGLGIKLPDKFWLVFYSQSMFDTWTGAVVIIIARAPLTDESGKFILGAGLPLPIWDFERKQFKFHMPKNISVGEGVTGILSTIWLSDNEAEARGQLILELRREGVGLW